MDKEYCPKLREDLFINDLYTTKSKDGYYVIGCYSEDSHMLVRENRISFYKKFFSQLDGSKSIECLSNMGFGSIENIAKMIGMLMDKGFIEGYHNKSNFNEVQNVSINIFAKNIPCKKQFTVTLCKKLVKLYKYVLIIAVLFLLVLLFKGKGVQNFQNIVSWLVSHNKKTGANMTGVIWYIYVFLLTPVFFVFHEAAHRITGIANGLKEGLISFVLFLGFMPTLYVRQKCIYSLERKKIVPVVLSGVLANLLLGIIMLDFSFLLDSHLLFYFALANMRMIYVNMLPLSLTDGYYLFCILSKNPNIRLDMYRVLANPKVFKNLSKKQKVFMLVALFAMVVIVSVELFWLLSFLVIGIRIPVLCILVAAYFWFMHIFSKTKIVKM